MKLLTRNVILLSLVFLSACATLTSDIEVETRENPAINYNSYTSYSWTGSAKVVFDPIGQWEQPTLDTDEEVRFLINRELRNRGLIQVDQSPDLLVAFAAGIDYTALELKENPDSDKKVLTNVPRASLVIVLIDARTGYAVWMGHAMGEVQQQQSIENIRARIDYAVSEIFKSYNK